MLEGQLDVQDIPEAWRAGMREDFGVEPETDRKARLQDVHWYAGLSGGAFQGDALGKLLDTQFYATALQAHPTILQQLQVGDDA